ncbi:MAG: hypothetical protein Kow0026_26510 [Oricola sp.]
MTDGTRLKCAIRIKGDPKLYVCGAGEKVLLALENAGQSAINVGCRRGGCGVCRVRVIAGKYATAKMSRAHVTEEEEAAGYALACRLMPASDLEIETAFLGREARRERCQSITSSKEE